ncbi:MAG: hypothetical protein U0T69_07190 [Chitinophagales bacterium]
MHKYKYLLMFFSGIVMLLVLLFFPISFDNNDDQAMYFISSGVLSGEPSLNIMHTNLIIGGLLKKIFLTSTQINWYTIYLQFIQCLALFAICLVFIYDTKLDILSYCLLLTFLIFGFSALCIVKVQYTIVALLSCAAALFCILSNLPTRYKFFISLIFITLTILIRKDCFYIFIAFNSAVLLFRWMRNEIEKSYLVLLTLSVILFFLLTNINDNNAVYKETNTYKYLIALDDITDKPVKYTAIDLEKFHFTEDDITLMKARYPAANSYSQGNNIIHLSQKIKTVRTGEQLLKEIKKFILDERYMILVYLISIIVLSFFAPKSYPLMLLNGFVFLTLIFYLAYTSRIPHRVTFPILIYVSILNLYYFTKSEIRYKNKLLVLFLFAILGVYKFYCTCKLIDMHKENHTIFSLCRNEINKHSDYLFISLHDGFPTEYMNAWQEPKDLFPGNNLIMTGWNVWAPDFKNVLHRHQLNNITTDLKNKKSVYFLTDSESYQQAFINVMKQRYNLICHFEKAQEDFKVLRPKKLIFDN